MSYFYNYELNLVDFSIRRTQILKRETRILKIDRIGYHTNINVSSLMKLYLDANSLYDRVFVNMWKSRLDEVSNISHK